MREFTACGSTFEAHEDWKLDAFTMSRRYFELENGEFGKEGYISIDRLGNGKDFRIYEDAGSEFVGELQARVLMAGSADEARAWLKRRRGR